MRSLTFSQWLHDQYAFRPTGSTIAALTALLQTVLVLNKNPVLSFCRAMLCKSAAYYLLNTQIMQYAHMRCLCVCLSVKFVDSVKTSNRILIFVPLLGSHTILVFPYQTSWHYSDGDPPNGGVECKGVWKNDDFRPISRFISELMQYRAIVTMEGEYETAPKLSNGTSLNDLKWPLTQISTLRLFNGK